MVLAIEGQKIETRPATLNVQNPQWDERFTFDILNGQEELQVFIANKDIYGQNDILG